LSFCAGVAKSAVDVGSQGGWCDWCIGRLRG